VLARIEPRLLSTLQQARANLEQARALREAGRSYRQIGRQLGLTSSQLCRIRKTLKREKGAATRLRQRAPLAGPRDLSVNASDLPPGLRRLLIAAGYTTLGELADRLADPERPGLTAIEGIGPTKAEMVLRLLERHGLFAGPDDLRSKVEALFPELIA
jgi:hypothetical protein